MAAGTASPAEPPATGETSVATAALPPLIESPPVKPKPEIAPSFDIVRVSPEGMAIIAGRAAPNAVVTILNDGAALGQVAADWRGEWVFMPDKRLSPGDRQLSLSSTGSQGDAPVASNGTVLLSVAGPRPASGAPETALAVLLPKDTAAPIRPLQVPEPPAGAAAPPPAESRAAEPPAKTKSTIALSLDVVQYDAAGRVLLSGRADPGSTLDIYLADRPLASVVADAEGRWSARPDALPEGTAAGMQELRLDRVDGGGKVAERIALPFEHAAPAAIPAEERYVVQPGNSLWRIAQSSYGTGFRFAVIYAANRERIRNPDLIYPGQIFRMPKS